MFNNTSSGRRDSMTPIVAPGYGHSWALPSLNQTIAPLSITKNPSGHAAEVHRYKVIIVENVVEFATRWEAQDFLGSHGIAVFDFDPSELDREAALHEAVDPRELRKLG